MDGKRASEVLSAPIAINRLTLANRMVLGPMAANAPNPDGSPSDQTVAFFERRARGGVGMIIAGGVNSTRRSYEETPFRPVLRLEVEEFLPGFRRIADAVHAHNVPLIAEIMPGFGRMGMPGKGRPIISASPINVVIPQENFPNGVLVPGGRRTPMPVEASIAEIETYEQEMIVTADRAMRAGWDGVEVAAHMSYFASSFLSPRTNWRTDHYGGSVENRARMLVNIVSGIRRKVGKDFVVGLRITANDYMDDGPGPHGFLAIAKKVEEAGIDYVALSAGCYEKMGASMPLVDGALVESGDAKLFRDALSVPVLIQGLHDPVNAAQALEGGHGDMVMLARQMLADPDYARKVTEGRIEDITRCERDNHCVRRLVMGMPIRCRLNPEMGRESRNGALPPLERIVKAPLEQAVLKLTGSPALVALAGAFTRKGQ